MKKTQKQKKKQSQHTIQKWIEKNLTVLIVISAIIIPFIVHILFSIPAPNNFWSGKWTAGEILGFMGTIFLGVIAIYQNKKMQDVNDRMLKIEENKMIPSIALTNITAERYNLLKTQSFPVICDDNEDEKVVMDNGTIKIKHQDELYFEIRNIKDVDIIDIGPTKLVQTISDKEDNIISQREIQLANSVNGAILKARDSRALLVTLYDFWENIDLKYPNGILKFEFTFYLLGGDGTEYSQIISIIIVKPDIVTSTPSPCIISEKISKPEKMNINR